MQISVQLIAAFLVASLSLSAIAQATFCRSPPQLRNGRYNGRVGGYYRRGHVITYSCYRGFQLEGVSQIICAYSWRYKSLQWSGDAPECIAYRRGMDDGDETFSSSSNPKSSSHSNSESRLGSNLDFSSGSKSHSSSGSKSYSSSGSKSHSSSSFRSRSDPYSNFRSMSSSHSSSRSISYSSSNRHGCCPFLSTPNNGDVRVQGHYQRGSIARYSCHYGYMLSATSHRRCLPNLSWSGKKPKCVPVQCPLLPRPNNGRVRYTEEGRSVGASVWYICNVGSTLVGEESRTCFKNLTWSSSAPICRRLSCDQPEKPVNGAVWFRSTVAGAKAFYRCNSNHRLVGKSVRICQRNQKWTPEVPKCERVSCERLVNPRNGFVVVGVTVDIGSYAKYNCYEGFYLVWPKFRQCLPTGWSGKEPKCIAIQCDALEAPAHGSVLHSKGRYINTTATYCCDYGYSLKQGSGDKKRTCQDDGGWTGKAPACIARCPVPSRPRQGYVRAQCRYQGCRATFSCRQGYKLYGARKARCLENGRWSRSWPVCTHKKW